MRLRKLLVMTANMLIIENSKFIEPAYFHVKPLLIGIRCANNPGVYLVGYRNKLLGQYDINKPILPLKLWKRIDN